MGIKLKVSEEEDIALPRSVLSKLSLEEGDSVRIRVDDANRLILEGEKDRVGALRRFRGIWRGEDVEDVFREIDQEWDGWLDRLSA